MFGALISAGAGLTQSDDPVLQVIGKAITILGPLLLGFVAKDAGVTGVER